MAFPVPPNESGRLAALHALAILDTPPEPIYDDVVALASAICRTPIAIINFVDGDRQWGKALVGLDSSEAPREASFCARTIVCDDGTMVIPDTLQDPSFATNPMVVGPPQLRFYAGAAIVTTDGYALGSVCVADRGPRRLDDRAIEALRLLARQTAAHLELRERSMQLTAAYQELHDMAIRDSLTGLANRALLLDRLTHALVSLRRNDGHLGVLFCDLDRFKAVNDTLGHQAGDDLLRAVAERLSTAARGIDTVARCGGDEFVVVCPGMSHPEDLEVVAGRLAEAVAQPLTLAGTTMHPRLSVGGCLATPFDTAAGALSRADAAMYAVKRERAADLARGAVVLAASPR